MRRLAQHEFLQACADYTKRRVRPNEGALAWLLDRHERASGDFYEVGAQLVKDVVNVPAFACDEPSLAQDVGFAIAVTRLFLGYHGRLLLADPMLEDLAWKTGLGMLPVEVLAEHLRKLTVSSASDFGPAVGG